MSANTSITEGGKARPFGHVKALMVQGEDGKYYPWFPESDRALSTLSVDKNGIYRASDKGVYGWSRVSVNVPTSEGVTGKDPDTGEEVYVHPDPETGELVTDVLPVEIRVIEPPTNSYGTYVDGQTITKDGMVVKAYGANGDEMQIVPIGEITINPTVAIYDESKDTRGTGEATSNLKTVLTQPISYSAEAKHQKYSIKTGNLTFEEGWNTGAIAAYDASTSVYINILIASATQPIVRTIHEGIGTASERTRTVNENVSSFTYDGKTVYYLIQSLNNNTANGWKAIHGAINSKGAGVPGGNDAWTMVYGTRKDDPAGSPQTITVSWPRPGDGAVLETTFDILVGPHGGTGDD